MVRETREETGRAFEPDALLGHYLWRGPSERTVLRVAFAGWVAERDDSIPLDRAIMRTLWLGRPELAARTVELRSPLVMRCIDDYLQGARYPLALLNHVQADELPRLAAAPALR